MGVGEALLEMLAAGACMAVAAVVWIEPVRQRRADRRYAEALREAKREAEVRHAEALLVRTRRQALADFAFEAAEQQAHAARARTGSGSPMPSPFRAASFTGEHDRLPLSEHDRGLLAALLESEFHHESRPPVSADTDPDAATSW